MRKNKGGIILFVLIALLVLGMVSAVLLFVRQDNPQKSETALLPIADNKSSCQSNPNPIFTSDITDLSKVNLIVPPGSIENDPSFGNLIKTHSYVQIKEKAPVYAPIDSYLYEGVKYVEEDMEQYSLFFEISCEVFYIFDHIQEPVQKIKDAFPDPATMTSYTKPLSKRIFVKAGELVGYTTGTVGAHHWDFGVYNNAKPNFLQDEAGFDYEISKRDTIANCPYDYFAEEKKVVYYSLFGNFIDAPAPTTFCKP